MFSIIDLLVLSQVPRMGPNRLRLFVSHFGDPARAREARPGEISALPGFADDLACEVSRFLARAPDDASRFAERQIAALEKRGGKIVTFWDDGYPALLARIYDPPPFFYLRGTLREEDQFALALVGTRAPSSYGRAMAGQFSRESASAGLCVVSGLARGIDTEAHRSALLGSGRTIAVVGSGLDVPYPPENASLAEQIASSGAVISEYPMGAKPEAMNFPRRNRIISGLALGTVVIESDLKGGAMITARTSLDQNREVFAVPGPAKARMSLGCNALIRDGRAKLAEGIEDVLVELALPLKPLLRRGEPRSAVPGDPSLFDSEGPS